ncbi:MAG: hypothetical protein AAF636_15415, partial [Pseudomonadota bacterium]
MNLEHVLGQIQSNCFNCHWVAPFLAVGNNCSMAHREAGGAGATHSIRYGPSAKYDLTSKVWMPHSYRWQ